MKKYRKKPVVIEAQQWHGLATGHTHVREFRDTDSKLICHVCKHCFRVPSIHGWVETLEGGHVVCPGDYIIKGVKGEYYPCKPDIFEETYEEA